MSVPQLLFERYRIGRRTLTLSAILKPGAASFTVTGVWHPSAPAKLSGGELRAWQAPPRW